MKWMNFGEKGRLLASMSVSRMINAYRNPKKLEFQSILIIKPDEIGDMCYSTHVFQMVKKQYPASKISLICKSYGQALLNSDKNIDTFYFNDTSNTISSSLQTTDELKK